MAVPHRPYAAFLIRIRRSLKVLVTSLNDDSIGRTLARSVGAMVALYILYWAGLGLWRDDINIPGGHFTAGSHFRGPLAWFLFAGVLSFSGGLLGFLAAPLWKRGSDLNWHFASAMMLGVLTFFVATLLAGMKHLWGA